MEVPNWLKGATATPRGFIGKNGELLKAVRLTAAQCDEFNNHKKEEKAPVVEPVVHHIEVEDVVVEEDSEEVIEVNYFDDDGELLDSEMTDTHSNIQITITGADEDGDGVLSENELRKLTKAKLESIARDYGIEIDRRKSKKDLLEELLEKIA